jgi:hypothetical protein
MVVEERNAVLVVVGDVVPVGVDRREPVGFAVTYEPKLRTGDLVGSAAVGGQGRVVVLRGRPDTVGSVPVVQHRDG